MITVNGKRIHRFEFGMTDLKDLLIDVLRFDGESIPDDCEMIIKESSAYNNDFDIILQFENDDLVSYEETMAEAEKLDEIDDAEAEKLDEVTDAEQEPDAEELEDAWGVGKTVSGKS